MTNVQDLITKYNESKVTIDGADSGQCTAVPHAWEAMLGLGLVLGNAIDTYAIAARTGQYQMVLNNPENFPLPGAILVYEANNTTIGTGPYGHTGVVVTAGVNSFTCFEQNDESHTPGFNLVAHVQPRPNYEGVYGWFYPNVLVPAATPPLAPAAPAVDPAVDPALVQLQNQVATLTIQLDAATTRATTAEGTVADQLQKLSDMQTQITQANTTNATLQKQLSDMEASANRITAAAPAATPEVSETVVAPEVAPAIASTPGRPATDGSKTVSVRLAPSKDPALTAAQQIHSGLSQVVGVFDKVRLIIFGNLTNKG